jgi:hypothetical protein
MINQRVLGKDGAQVDVEPGELRHNLLARLDLPRVPKQARSQEKRDALVQAAML